MSKSAIKSLQETCFAASKQTRPPLILKCRTRDTLPSCSTKLEQRTFLWARSSLFSLMKKVTLLRSQTTRPTMLARLLRQLLQPLRQRQLPQHQRHQPLQQHQLLQLLPNQLHHQVIEYSSVHWPKIWLMLRELILLRLLARAQVEG